MTRIYRYILDTDGGMAPCIDQGIVSLATCKPVVRRMAGKGDWVAGFMPGSDHRGELAWAGRVETILNHGEYYRRSAGMRSDAVYQYMADGNYEKQKVGYHCDPKQQHRDHENSVLLFDREASWYFGSTPVALPDYLGHLSPAGQGYHVNFRRAGDLEQWEDWLWFTKPGIHGTPRNALVLCTGCRFCDDEQIDPPKCGKTQKGKRSQNKRRC